MEKSRHGWRLTDVTGHRCSLSIARQARREEAGAPPARSASTVGATGFRCDEPSSGALELEFSWFAATHAVYSTPYYGAPQRQGVHRGGGRTRVL